MSTSSISPAAFKITQVGINALTAAGHQGLKVSITTFKLGSAYGYTPALGDTSLHGGVVYTSQPAAWNMLSESSRDVVCKVPATAGPFAYGEIGLYLEDGTLFALAAFGSLQVKSSAMSGIANALTFHCVLDVGANPAVIQVIAGTAGVVANVGNTHFVTGPDLMPGKPNALIVTEPVNGSNSLFMTYSNYNQWNVQNYLQVASGTVTALSADKKTVTSVAFSELASTTLAGDYLLQDMVGNVRVVAYAEPGEVVLTYPIAGLNVGDTVLCLSRATSLSDFIALEDQVAENNAEQTQALNAATQQMGEALAAMDAQLAAATGTLTAGQASATSSQTAAFNTFQATITSQVATETSRATAAETAETARATAAEQSLATQAANNFGRGQQWYNYIAYSLIDSWPLYSQQDRLVNVGYTNTTQKPIMVAISVQLSGATISLAIGGVVVQTVSGGSTINANTGFSYQCLTGVVPPGIGYIVATTEYFPGKAFVTNWVELR